MATQDTCCTIVPYFNVQAGKMEAFKKLAVQLVATTSEQAECLYYGFCFNGDQAHCREGYANADALLFHVEQVGPIIQELLQISDLVRCEVHGPDDELAKLREPLAGLTPAYFTLEYGFRR